MTAPTPADVFQQYAHRLQLAAPQEFEQLLVVLDAYATEIVLDCTNAPQDEVLVSQGKARAFLHILNLFRTCGNPRRPQPTQQP